MMTMGPEPYLTDELADMIVDDITDEFRYPAAKGVRVYLVELLKGLALASEEGRVEEWWDEHV